MVENTVVPSPLGSPLHVKSHFISVPNSWRRDLNWLNLGKTTRFWSNQLGGGSALQTWLLESHPFLVMQLGIQEKGRRH